MTLGMAARSAARKEIGVLSQPGANSLMKIADPTPRGTAMRIARNEDTRVPYRKGSAANSSRTGSQVLFVTKVTPNFRIAGRDSRIRSEKRRVRPSTHSAKSAVVFSNRKSFMFAPTFIFPVAGTLAMGRAMGGAAEEGGSERSFPGGRSSADF